MYRKDCICVMSLEWNKYTLFQSVFVTAAVTPVIKAISFMASLKTDVVCLHVIHAHRLCETLPHYLHAGSRSSVFAQKSRKEKL